MQTDSTLSARALPDVVSADPAAAIAPAAATALPGLFPQSSVISTADPIFGVIERHRQADQAWADRLSRHGEFMKSAGSGANDADDPAWPECNEAGDREGEAYRQLWRTMPTTAEGFAPLFVYLQAPRSPPELGDRETAAVNTIFGDAVRNIWWSDPGMEEGAGGVPAMMDWLRMMELALRRMVTA
jgi:hypothetical protein